MATRDPNHPDTTEAIQAKAWLRIGDFLKEAQFLLSHYVEHECAGVMWLHESAERWLDEYDAHQIPQQETPQ